MYNGLLWQKHFCCPEGDRSLLLVKEGDCLLNLLCLLFIVLFFFSCKVGSDVLETELNAAQHERCDAELESANCDSLTRPWLLRRLCILQQSKHSWRFSFSPRTSFAGHLAGILVGLMYTHGPLKKIMESCTGMEQNRRHERHLFDPWVGKVPWRRKWQPTPVFLPGKSHGQRSLAGCSPWGCKESDMTEELSTQPRTPWHD